MTNLRVNTKIWSNIKIFPENLQKTISIIIRLIFFIYKPVLKGLRDGSITTNLLYHKIMLLLSKIL